MPVGPPGAALIRENRAMRRLRAVERKKAARRVLRNRGERRTLVNMVKAEFEIEIERLDDLARRFPGRGFDAAAANARSRLESIRNAEKKNGAGTAKDIR